jgi:2-polyprenyl-3-methyl-5-hydroxy-6-metoxy-1,4-benzoquinol methylase
MVIDRELNWGRAVVADYLKRIAPFANVLDVGAGGGLI